MTAPQGKPYRILWALDPFSDGEAGRARAVEALSVIANARDCEIEPVYVLGADTLHWVGHVAPPNIDRFIQPTEEAMGKYLKTVSLKGLKKGVVLANRQNSKRLDIKVLLEHGHQNNVDLIVINTHGRAGVMRFFLGSFAESLLLKSDIPLLFVSPHTQRVKNLGRVLFPSDFSPSSEAALALFLEDFAGVAKEVTLFNKIPHPVDAFVQTGVAAVGGGWVSVQQFMEAETAQREKVGAELAAKFLGQGVRLDAEVDGSPGAVVESILEKATTTKSEMIAMSAESGLLSTILIGSIARQVIRGAEMPVWVHYRKTGQK